MAPQIHSLKSIICKIPEVLFGGKGVPFRYLHTKASRVFLGRLSIQLKLLTALLSLLNSSAMTDFFSCWSRGRPAVPVQMPQWSPGNGFTLATSCSLDRCPGAVIIKRTCSYNWQQNWPIKHTGRFLGILLFINQDHD